MQTEQRQLCSAWLLGFVMALAFSRYCSQAAAQEDSRQCICSDHANYQPYMRQMLQECYTSTFVLVGQLFVKSVYCLSLDNCIMP